jgi:hypothetical protein
MKKAIILTMIALLLLNLTYAQTPQEKVKELEKKIKELEKKIEEKSLEIEVLKDEIRRLRLEIAMPQIEMKSYFGLGPAASKIYYTPYGLSIAGYGEITYENFIHGSKSDKGDVLRFIPYIGYKFSDKILVNSELEIEHAGIGNIGDPEPEVFVEFLYLDFMIDRRFNLRPGLFLVPFSMMNEYHEPPVFHGMLRPDVERFIIPTVWREIGLMAYGKLSPYISYKTAIMNGLRTDKIKDWIKGGRQKGAQVNFDKFAWVMRINLSDIIKGLDLGSAFYAGAGSNGKGGSNEKGEEAAFNMFVIDAQYRTGNLLLKGLYVLGNASGNDSYKKEGRAKKVNGWYFEAGYNIMPYILAETIISLNLFARYEKYNLNQEVFKGVPDKTKDRTMLTIGLDFKPHPQVVIKVDYQIRNTSSGLPEGKGEGMDEWKIDQFNIGIGFIF